MSPQYRRTPLSFGKKDRKAYRLFDDITNIEEAQNSIAIADQHYAKLRSLGMAVVSYSALQVVPSFDYGTDAPLSFVEFEVETVTGIPLDKLPNGERDMWYDPLVNIMYDYYAWLDATSQPYALSNPMEPEQFTLGSMPRNVILQPWLVDIDPCLIDRRQVDAIYSGDL